MSDISTTPQKQTANYFNVTNNGKSASEILGTSAANSAQTTANEFKNFLKEAVDTVNSGVKKTKNTISGMQNLSQEVSNQTGKTTPQEDISGLYSKDDLLKEVYGEIPATKTEQKIVALGDKEENKTTDKVTSSDSTDETSVENGNTDVAETKEVTDSAQANTTENNSEDTENTDDKVAAVSNGGDEDEDSGNIMDILSNIATIGTIASLIV